MKFGVYSIQDMKTGYLSPTFEMNDAVAMRNFEHAVQNGESILFSHANDFRLMKIGTFDSDTGALDSCLPVIIIEGKDVVI